MASGSLALQRGERKPHGWSQRKQRVSWASVLLLPPSSAPPLHLPQSNSPSLRIMYSCVEKAPPSLTPSHSPIHPPPATTTLSDCIISQYAHQIWGREAPERPNGASVFTSSTSLSWDSNKTACLLFAYSFFSSRFEKLTFLNLA